MKMAGLNELRDGLQSGKLSSRGLIEQCLQKIAEPGGEGERAFLQVDADAARAAADYMDGLRMRSRHPSPYAGIPMSVKDLFDMAGDVTGAGSVVLNDEPMATHDAPCIARLKAVGFISVGRTNMTEFAYSGVGLNPHYGTPSSVWDRATGRIPGGSSSGAGVSVADGMCAFGIGTDTGGSCRVPAAFNGITGFKSSHGRVPLDGVYPLAKSLDTVGPLAGSVTCCAIIDALMAEDWPGVIARRDPATLRFGILQTMVQDDLDGVVARTFEKTITRLGGAGVEFSEVAFEELAGLPAINAKGGIGAVEACAVHAKRLLSDGDRYDQRVRTRIMSGNNITGPEHELLKARRAEYIALANERLADLDGFVLPTVPMVAPAISALDLDADYNRLNYLSLRNTFVGNFLDTCAISLPCHRPGEAPVGFMIMAPHGRDQALFSAALAVEGVLPGAKD